MLHARALFILPLLVLSPYAAPIYAEPGPVARAVTALPHIPLHAIQSNGPTSYTPTPNKVTSLWQSTAKAPSHFDKLKLTAQPPTSISHVAPIHPLATHGFGMFGTVTTTCTPKRNPICPSSSSPSPSARLPVGTVLHLHPDGKDVPYTEITKNVTLGKHLGFGRMGAVYDVESHDLGDHHGPLVAKIYFKPGPTSSWSKHAVNRSNQVEINNIRQVEQLRASGTHDDHTWVVMDKAKGTNLYRTEAYKNAGPKQTVLEAKAKALAGESRLYFADKYRLVHNDVHFGNVNFEEENNQLIKAHLFDWGIAQEAPPKGPDGKFTQKQIDALLSLYNVYRRSLA